MPSEYQQLLNTSVVRLDPGTISRNCKKSRLYSQVFCFEVNLRHSLQTGDLVLVLETLDSPNPSNKSSNVCFFDIYDQFPVIIQGSFGKNITNILHTKYLTNLFPKGCLLKSKSDNYKWDTAELSILFQKSNIEPKHFLLHFNSCQRFGQENLRKPLDGLGKLAWRRETQSMLEYRQSFLPPALWCSYTPPSSAGEPFSAQAHHRPGLILGGAGGKTGNLYNTNIRNLLRLLLNTSEMLAGETSCHTIANIARRGAFCSHTNWAGLWKFIHNFLNQEIHLLQRRDELLVEEVDFPLYHHQVYHDCRVLSSHIESRPQISVESPPEVVDFLLHHHDHHDPLLQSLHCIQDELAVLLVDFLQLDGCIHFHFYPGSLS